MVVASHELDVVWVVCRCSAYNCAPAQLPMASGRSCCRLQ